ncbi:hypothetical protein FOZ61_009667 [Perkinsus olseni]|uniref:Uncharacterized protein n=1 Tax=Perkinsus olseni TaxID=32597 RepID=A0A7J6KYN8_PEROL|nr:hypothetical protein FOZ61_009667 [Perkinsus olseni]
MPRVKVVQFVMIVRRWSLRAFTTSGSKRAVGAARDKIGHATYLCNRVHHLATSGSRSDMDSTKALTGGSSRKQAAAGIIKQLEELLLGDPAPQRGLDMLGHREIGKLLAGAATLKVVLPPKLLNEILTHHWLPALLQQRQSSKDLGSSLCIVLSALSRIKQQHPRITRVPESLLDRVAALIEDALTNSLLSTKDICSLLLYLSRLEHTPATMFGSVVEKLDLCTLSCRDLADLLQAFGEADLISIPLLSNTLPHATQLLAEFINSNPSTPDAAGGAPPRDLSIIASAYSRSIKDLPVPDTRPFFAALVQILRRELERPASASACSLKDAIAFLVSLSRAGVEDDGLFDTLFYEKVLPQLSTLDGRSAGYVISAYASVECQRRRQFELQGLQVASNPRKRTEELLAGLRSKASSLAAADHGKEHLRVLVNFAYEFSRLDAGSGSEGEVMALLETAIREGMTKDLVASAPHSVALAASAFGGVGGSRFMDELLPASLRQPFKGRSPFAYFSSGDLGLLASAAVKHSQLTGSTDLVDSVVAYVMAEDGLLSPTNRSGFTPAALASLADTLSSVEPRVVDRLTAVERSNPSPAAAGDEICALCEASIQSGALVPRLGELLELSLAAPTVPTWSLEESASILRCLVSLGSFGAQSLSSDIQKKIVSAIASVVKAASVAGHASSRPAGRALPPWSSLVNSCCTLILDHSGDGDAVARGRGILRMSPEVKLAFKGLLLVLASSAAQLEANPAKAIYSMWPILQAVSALDSSIDRSMHLESCGISEHVKALLLRVGEGSKTIPSSRYAALALHSLASMRFNEIPTPSLNVLLSSYDHHAQAKRHGPASGDVARVLYALGRLGIPSPLAHRLHHWRFGTAWELTTALHALALLNLENHTLYLEAIRKVSENRNPSSTRAQARQILTYHLAAYGSDLGPLKDDMGLLRTTLRLFSGLQTSLDASNSSSSELHGTLYEALNMSENSDVVVSSEVPAGPYQIDSVVSFVT